MLGLNKLSCDLWQPPLFLLPNSNKFQSFCRNIFVKFWPISICSLTTFVLSLYSFCCIICILLNLKAIAIDFEFSRSWSTLSFCCSIQWLLSNLGQFYSMWKVTKCVAMVVIYKITFNGMLGKVTKCVARALFSRSLWKTDQSTLSFLSTNTLIQHWIGSECIKPTAGHSG